MQTNNGGNEDLFGEQNLCSVVLHLLLCELRIVEADQSVIFI